MKRRYEGPSVLALVGDRSGPTIWRVFCPFTALKKDGYTADWDFKDADGIGRIAPLYDGYVLPRMSWPPEKRRAAEMWFESVRRAGKFVVFDCDDDIFSADLTRRSVEMDWTDGRTPRELEAERVERIWALRQCDGATVSTRRLATVVRGVTDRPVVVVPNAIDVPWFRGVLRATTRQIPPLTIGWAGGRRPDRDVAVMAAAWGRVATRLPSVRFVVAGWAPPVVTAAVPEDRLVRIPWLPAERYPQAHAEIDIACCSVSDEPFNRCKSVIKAYEAAIAGGCVVASPALYGRLITDGEHGRLAETVDDWEAALMDLATRPSLRSLLGGRLRRHVERRCSLQANLWRWPASWRLIAEDAARRRGSLVSGTIGMRNVPA